MRDRRRHQSNSDNASPDADFDDRLRRSLTDAAPEALPTIGVRETIVHGVRARVRRRQRVAGAVAVSSLLMAGLTTGVAALHSSQHPATNSAARKAPSSSSGHQTSEPAAGGAEPGPSYQAKRSGCGKIVEGAQTIGGCYGVFSGSQDLSMDQPGATGSSSGGPVPPPTPPLSATSPTTSGSTTSGSTTGSTTEGTATSGSAAAGSSGSTGSGTGSTSYGTAKRGSTGAGSGPVDGTYRVLVPVGR